MLPKIYSPGHVIQNWATVCSYMYIHCMLLFTFPEASTVRTKWSHLPLWRLRGGGAEGSERREDREGALSARPRNEGEGESRERGEVGWMNDQRKDIKSREGGLGGWVGGGSRRVGQSTCASVGGGICHNTSPSLVLPLVQEIFSHYHYLLTLLYISQRSCLGTPAAIVMVGYHERTSIFLFLFFLKNVIYI